MDLKTNKRWAKSVEQKENVLKTEIVKATVTRNNAFLMLNIHT